MRHGGTGNPSWGVGVCVWEYDFIPVLMPLSLSLVNTITSLFFFLPPPSFTPQYFI